MASIDSIALLDRFKSRSDIYLAVGVLVVLAIMVIPLPTLLLDLFLSFNFTMAVTILLVAIYTREPLQFSVFPSILLLLTLFRLSLNVASTRLILGEAYAGKVISAFGNFVVTGNYVVGLVIFLILVIIQFVVITKGAGRIAEVAARFTLDAMPGKQMSIDADLNAGLIDERTALKKREAISREADFYGAMDGASKFVRGDAIAGLIITVINILAGFVIGMFQHGMSAQQALQSYIMLTVGDGLVSQIPALLISTAAGIIVSRAASDFNMGHDVAEQFLAQPKALYIVAGVVFLFGITPGLPALPFFALALGMFAAAHAADKSKASQEQVTAPPPPPAEKVDRPEDYLQVDVLELEIGYGLILLVDAAQGGDLLNRITALRKQLAFELGVIIPPIRIRDNVRLKANEYLIKVKGVEVTRGELLVGHCLALVTGTVTQKLDGLETVEPAFGLPAVWITTDQRESAEKAGYTVIETTTVLVTHLKETLRANAHLLLSREEVQKLIELVKEKYPTVVSELIPNLLSIGQVQKVLQNLLKENVPIKDLTTILEVLADHAPASKDPDTLTGYARLALSRVIFSQYQSGPDTVSAIMLDPKLEQFLMDSLRQFKSQGMGSLLNPSMVQQLLGQLRTMVGGMINKGLKPVMVCSHPLRFYWKKIFEAEFPNLAVLSFSELPANVEIQSEGVLTTNL
jgi:flagellar biosynthesis protein FlhA